MKHNSSNNNSIIYNKNNCTFTTEKMAAEMIIFDPQSYSKKSVKIYTINQTVLQDVPPYGQLHDFLNKKLNFVFKNFFMSNFWLISYIASMANENGIQWQQYKVLRHCNAMGPTVKISKVWFAVQSLPAFL